jgi:hypothetical protein
MTSQEGSGFRTGQSKFPDNWHEIGPDPCVAGLVELMKQSSIPLTRENYIGLAYGNPLPEEWTAEHEADLPYALQDWSRFG